MRTIANRIIELENDHDLKYINHKDYIQRLFILIAEQMFVLKILEDQYLCQKQSKPLAPMKPPNSSKL